MQPLGVRTGPETSTRVGNGARRLDVQGLRAVAVLAVVVYHAGVPLPGGFTGVDVFFVISGYVITLMLLREWQQSGRISLSQFYLRRFKRLVPALGVVVSVTLLASIFFLPPIGEENRVLYTAAGALLFAANVVIDVLSGDYFAVRSQSNPLLHTWTLAVEEQFYVLFPLLLVIGLTVVGRRIGSRRGAFILIGAVTVLSFTLAELASRFDLPFGESLFGFYSPLSRAWEFGVGSLVALAAPVIRMLPGRLTEMLSVVGGGAIITGFLLIDSDTPFPGVWALIPVGGTALLLIAGDMQSRNRVNAFLTYRPTRWLGDLSYSWYLWHWPIIVIVHLTWPSSTWATLIAAASSLVPAVLSYYLLEKPYRDEPTPDRASVVKYILKVLWLPVSVWFAAWWVMARFIEPFVRDEVGRPAQDSVSIETECISEEGFNAQWANDCTFFPDNPGTPIYLVGDSNAAHFDQAILEIAEKHNRPATLITAPSCLPLRSMDIVYDTGEEVFAWCSQYNPFVYEFLETAPDGTVVFAFYDVLSWSDDRYYLTEEESSPVGGRQEKSEFLAAELTADLAFIENLGHELVLVQAVPQFRTPSPPWEPRECNLIELVADSCARQVPIEVLDQTQKYNRSAISSVGNTLDIPVLDLRPELCREGVCSTGDGEGFLTYRDDIHISVEEAKRLVPAFERVLIGEQ